MVKSLKSKWGSVNPYSRHSPKCINSDHPNVNDCRCPKWLYVYKRGEKRKRYALNTPSWAEALKEATRVLDGMNPEIAEARAAKRTQEAKLVTVLDAIQMWYDRTIRKVGDETSTINQYRSIFGWVEENDDRTVHGHLLKYIAEFNQREAPEDRIEFIQQITPLWLQQFHDAGMNGLKPDTQRHRWGVIRSFFAHLHRLGVIESDPSISIQRISSSGEIGHIPFTEAQYKAILDNADWYVDDRVRDGEREVYCTRMHAFLELLRWTGMDLIDAVQFRPAVQIDAEGVLRYRRTKTGALAVIPLQPHLPALLRAVPGVLKSVRGMPFRYQDNELKSDVHNWSRRCANLFKLADIQAVTLTPQDGKTYTKKPEAKAFRHSFAVWALTVARMRVEIVSKMLGHKLVSTTEKHYLPWIKGRDAYLIDEVREAQRELAKRKKKPQ